VDNVRVGNVHLFQKRATNHSGEVQYFILYVYRIEQETHLTQR